MAKKKEQKDMAQEQELRLKFQQKLIEILELGKKKKNMLEYQEIADFFKDLNLDPEKFEMVIESAMMMTWMMISYSMKRMR